MARYQQMFRDADRQQAMADALLQQSTTPRQTPQQGRIASNTGFADGLGQLGQAMMARRADKKATATRDKAEEEKRQAQAAALAGMSGQGPEQNGSLGPPAPMNPYAQSQAAIEAGVDPNLVAAYMQQQSPQKPVELSYGAQLRDPKTGALLAQNERNPSDAQTGVPGSLQELEAINRDRAARGEPPVKPEDYLSQRRGSSADSQLYAQYVQGLPEGVQPLPMDQFLLQFRSGVAGGTTRATETAKVNVEAQADLPRVEQNAGQVTQVIDQLLNHPGFSGIFGKSSVLQPQMIPGTDWADANALLNQVKGKTFLEAFATLKGGGQITELEGIKAQQAIGRLETAQSDEAAKLALQELKEIARMGVERARQKAGMGTGQPGQNQPPTNQAPTPTKYTYDPATGNFEPS